MMEDDTCEDHHTKFKGMKHPDANMKTHKVSADHERAVGHPAHHTPGRMPSQLNPDMGPHHHKR